MKYIFLFFILKLSNETEKMDSKKNKGKKYYKNEYVVWYNVLPLLLVSESHLDCTILQS